MVQKMKEKKGFTLAELLVVVAIIGVLVAVSIPIFTSQLEKSRESVDISNMRAAYAVAQVDVLTEGYKDIDRYTASGSTYSGYYDISGNMKATKAGIATYGKSSVTGKQTTSDLPVNGNFDWDGNVSGKLIKVTIKSDATDGKYVTVAWEN
ncbi:type IV pilin protein [Oribacterium sp. oral taxon 102]|uniref:type IV pilin protein n=1 Tax=Oribacterium sp. oral taxon 102 TaxID=671214 RepID=UPI001FAB89B7|nr:prepilin-type N-terminal cleavage/methylation domain-containing protein [Oribacterium sp. oral taxon 102]